MDGVVASVAMGVGSTPTTCACAMHGVASVMAANTKGRIPSGREAHGAPWSLWLLAMVTIAIAALAGCTGSPPCGEANGPCCGTSCGQGFVCRTRGDAGACVSCGSIGGECCEGVNA